MEKVEQGMGMEPIGDDLAVADRSPHNHHDGAAVAIGREEDSSYWCCVRGSRSCQDNEILGPGPA